MMRLNLPELCRTDVISLCHSTLPSSLIEFTHSTVQRASEGSVASVWFIGTDLVLRIASDEERSVCHVQELHVRDVVRRHCARVGLPGSIIPRCLAEGQWGERHLAFTFDHRIDGVSLEDTDPTAKTEDDLVLLMGMLRDIPVEDEALDCLENQGDLDRHDLMQLRRDAEAAWARLSQQGQLPRYDEGAAGISTLTLPNIAFSTDVHTRLVLLHADIKAEHILVDKATGSIKGVLDWTDAAIGDPATDIAGLATSVGSHIAARVASRAGFSEDVIAKGVFVARCDAVQNLCERVEGDDDDVTPTSILLKQFHRAFQT